MTVNLPEGKVQNVLELCNQGLRLQEMTIRFVLHIIGTLNSYSVAVEYGANHFKGLEKDQIATLRKSKGDFDAIMTMSQRGKQDLNWWKDNVKGASLKIKTKNPKNKKQKRLV